jgi:hypothetical protein
MEDDVMLVQGLQQLLDVVRPAGHSTVCQSQLHGHRGRLSLQVSTQGVPGHGHRIRLQAGQQWLELLNLYSDSQYFPSTLRTLLMCAWLQWQA